MIAVDSQAHGGMPSSSPFKAKVAIAQEGQAAGKSCTDSLRREGTNPSTVQGEPAACFVPSFLPSPDVLSLALWSSLGSWGMVTEGILMAFSDVSGMRQERIGGTLSSKYSSCKTIKAGIGAP